METETERRVYHYPLSGEEVAALIPDMHLIAARYTKCESTRNDYVQLACLYLLTKKKPHSTSPPVNQIRREVHRQWKNDRQKRLGQFPELPDGTVIEPISPETGDRLTQIELERFDGLNLSEPDRKVARLYWLWDFNLDQIQEKLGVGREAVVASLKRVREAVRERWL